MFSKLLQAGHTQSPPGDWWRGFVLARFGVALYDSRQYHRKSFA